MLAIVVALPAEAKSFICKMDNVQEFSIAGKLCYKGTVYSKEVVVAISGVGKVNAGLTTQMLIDKFSPELVINFGTAGGMNSSVKVGEYYLIEKCAQFDFDLSELDNVPVGYIQDYDTVLFPTYTEFNVNLLKGRVASADRFNDDPNDIKLINDMTCSIRDMEGGAIGQVCLANNVKLIMIKGITDVYGSQTAKEQFLANLRFISDGFGDIICNLIKCL